MSFISDLGDLLRRLTRIEKVDIGDGISRGIQTIRSEAVNLCPADTGELRQSIYADVSREHGKVTGTCWTNKDYAIYVEYGTGPKGAADHRGISPDASPAYTLSPWWIHESQVDRRVAERCHWFYIDTPNGRFYQCTGQAAQPFMYPAYADNKDIILKEIKSEFTTNLKGLI